MKNTTQRRFKCPECLTIQTAPKSSSRMTAVGHIKTMYCPWCKKTQDFTQVRYTRTLSGEEIN